MKKEKMMLALTGLVVALCAFGLVYYGNPRNMGFCIACFIRDIAGSLRFHNAEVVQYMRPEIPSLILGSFLISIFKKEFHIQSGSSPVLRFFIAFMISIGALCFLGCPLRMVLRLAGGDLYAVFGLIGFALGIGVGCFFLQNGFSLGRSHKSMSLDGYSLPFSSVFLLVILVFFPTILSFSSKGPGSMHAPIILSIIAGLVVGVFAQRTKFCFAGGIRDVILLRDFTLITGLLSVFVFMTIFNISNGWFKLSFEGQNIVNTSNLYNALGMFVVGLGSIMLGGCPLRQLILAGEGNSDSAISVLGMLVGTAIVHNFKLAGNAVNSQPNKMGKIAVLISIVVLLVICISVTLQNKKKGGENP